MSLLEVSDLVAGYGQLEILSGVNLTADEGEFVSIVGPNGAGKSTVMKSVFGLTTHMGGSIVFDGNDITSIDSENIINYGLGYVPQSKNVFTNLTVKENLRMGAYTLDEFPNESLNQVYDRFPDLKERPEQKAGTLSGGQQRMVAIGRALMLDPKLIMLDEPSAGLAPNLVGDMFDKIVEISDAGTSVLIVEQNAKEALRQSDRGYVLVQGENRFEGPGEELLNDEEVRREFLGG